MEPVVLLVVDDEPVHVDAITRAFAASGVEVRIRVVSTLDEFRSAVESSAPSIALMDLMLPDGRTDQILAAQVASSQFPVVVMTSFGDERAAVQALKGGAVDYVVKSPEAFADMPHTVERALREWRLRQDRQRMQKELAESEERYRELVENLSDVLYQVDLAGTLLYVSPSAEKVFGHNSFLRDAGGRIVGTLGSGEDVTAHRHAELTLRQANLQFESIFRAMPDLFFRMSGDGTIIDFLAGCNQDLYVPPEQFLGKRMQDVLPPGVGQQMSQAVEQALSGTPARVEYVLPMPEGDQAFEARLVDVDRQEVIAVVRDISDRKASELALRDSELRFRRTFDESPIGAALVSLDMRFQRVNRELCRIMDVPEQELVGKSFTDITHPDDLEESVSLSHRLLNGDIEQFQVAKRYLRPDGSTVWARTSVRLLRDSEGRPLYFIPMVEDITGQRHAEQERLELERRLLHAQKLESLGVLAGGIAHDFNNLLTTILGNLDLALEDLPLQSRARAHLEQAMAASRRATDLTRQMLAYSGKGRFVSVRLDLGRLARENTDLFRASAARTSRFELLASPRPALMDGDPGQIQQLMMNLITNASEAIGNRPGVITLSTGTAICDDNELNRSRLEEKPEPGTFAFLEVSDTGCGMDQETQELLFDPFFTTKFTGRGLGMSAVLGIVSGHQGAIFVDSETGQGTTIRVLFPACDDELPEGDDPAASVDPAAESRLHAGLVMVVDDDHDVLRVCQQYIRHLGYKSLGAISGDEALALFDERGDEITCVILDLTMPGQDGVAVFHQMIQRRADAKILLASGYGEDDVQQRFTGAMPAGFLHKPYRLRELDEKLSRLLEGSPQQ